MTHLPADQNAKLTKFEIACHGVNGYSITEVEGWVVGRFGIHMVHNSSNETSYKVTHIASGWLCAVLDKQTRAFAYANAANVFKEWDEIKVVGTKQMFIPPELAKIHNSIMKRIGAR